MRLSSEQATHEDVMVKTWSQCGPENLRVGGTKPIGAQLNTL